MSVEDTETIKQDTMTMEMEVNPESESVSPKLLKSFIAKDSSGILVRVAVWEDGRVTLCTAEGPERKESTCHTSECKEGEDAETCYEEAKKLFGERFRLDISEVVGSNPTEEKVPDVQT